MDLELFGKFITDARLFTGLSREKMAARIGVSATAYSTWENGARWPSFQTLPLLADALGITVDDIVEGSGHEYSELERPNNYRDSDEFHYRNIL